MEYGVNINEANYLWCDSISHPKIEHSEVIGIIFDIRYNIINPKPNYITFDYVRNDLSKYSIKKFKTLDDVMFEVKGRVFELFELYNLSDIKTTNKGLLDIEKEIKEKINNSVKYVCNYFRNRPELLI